MYFLAMPDPMLFKTFRIFLFVKCTFPLIYQFFIPEGNFRDFKGAVCCFGKLIIIPSIFLKSTLCILFTAKKFQLLFVRLSRILIMTNFVFELKLQFVCENRVRKPFCLNLFTSPKMYGKQELCEPGSVSTVDKYSLRKIF